jgi:ribosomal protein S18 acetylase RimI-like enzyme
VGNSQFRLRLATEAEYTVIVRLIGEAADWLRTKGTDQWAKPWRSEEDRNQRILRDLRERKTWVVLDSSTVVATITADSEHYPLWPQDARREAAIYVSRLVVRRTHAGQGLGAALLDWVGLLARQRYGAEWIRVDVWTTNQALHAYYRRHGFEFYGVSAAGDDYPSAALFQKRTGRIMPSAHAPFKSIPASAG